MMKKLAKKVILPLLHLFIDKYSYLTLNKNTNFLKLAWYSLRFRLASRGIFLTENEKRFASLEDKYRGERCFIIGNGPSLNKLDLTNLKNEYTFGVNAIYLNFERMKFHPTFYVVEDYLVAEDRANEINKYDNPQLKFFGSYLDYVLNKDSKTIYTNVCLNYQEDNYEPLFSNDCLRRIGVGGSVSFICLQLAYYMGFKEVYMIGFDHNYDVPKNADLKKSAVIMSKEDDVNHFAPGYFGKGYRWHDPNVERMERGFIAADKAFRKDGRKIFNATKGGKLEVFQRVEFDALFDRCKQLQD
jgi:hypothetical protein